MTAATSEVTARMPRFSLHGTALRGRNKSLLVHERYGTGTRLPRRCRDPISFSAAVRRIHGGNGDDRTCRPTTCIYGWPDNGAVRMPSRQTSSSASRSLCSCWCCMPECLSHVKSPHACPLSPPSRCIVYSSHTRRARGRPRSFVTGSYLYA